IGPLSLNVYRNSWDAPAELDDVPKRPPIPGCNVPPHHTGRQQAFVNVTIEIDGPLNQFAKKADSKDLELVGQKFTLSPGSNESKSFSINTESYEEMLGPDGTKSLNR